MKCDIPPKEGVKVYRFEECYISDKFADRAAACEEHGFVIVPIKMEPFGNHSKRATVTVEVEE